MELRTNYGLIFIFALAIAYILIGIIRLLGYNLPSKLLLMCSIFSVMFAIISLLESFVTGYKQAENELLHKINVKKTKITDLHEKYVDIINFLHKLKSILFFITVLLFFFFISTDFISENAVLADGLSLISFSLVILDIALKMKLETVINNFHQQYKNKGDI